MLTLQFDRIKPTRQSTSRRLAPVNVLDRVKSAKLPVPRHRDPKKPETTKFTTMNGHARNAGLFQGKSNNRTEGGKRDDANCDSSVIGMSV